MLSFKQFINESYSSPGQIFNKRQMKSIASHPDYKTYVDSHEHKIYARLHKRDDPKSAIRNVVMANAAQKHTMTVAITKQGKILNHEIHRKVGDNEWKLLKHSE